MEKLYQVLLIDDDLLVLDDLKTIIDWEKEGFHIAAIAGNGEEALRIIEKMDIDILIVDIEMPLLNGLEFLRLLHQKNLSICSLLLTAYSRFDYAREALSLGVSNYILKYELTPELLLENLRIMRNQVREIKEKGKLNQHYQIQNFLQGNRTIALENIIPLKNEEKQIILVNVKAAVPLGEGLNHLKSNNIELENYQNETLSFDSLKETTFIYSINEKEVYLLIGCTWDVTSLSCLQFNEILNFFQSHWKCKCFIIASSPCTYDQLSSIYTIMNQFTKHFYLPFNHCCNINEYCLKKTMTCEDWHEVFNGFSFIYQEDAIFQMKTYLELLQQYQPPVHKVLLDIQDLIHQLQRLMQKNMDDDLAEILKKWLWIYNYEQLETFILEIIRKLERLKGQRYSRKVIEMMNYLQQKCENENVLEDLSEYMSMNREYMSKLFKKETGQSLSQRLQEVRMKKAYQLLSTTHLKIYEIAEQCGYNSSQYFSMVFMKYYQCSPSDVMNKGEDNGTSIER